MSALVAIAVIVFWVTLLVVLRYVMTIAEDLDRERGTAELTEEDRNLLKRHIRALEDNTQSNKRGRP